MISKNYNVYIKFIKFCVVGGINTLISLAIYWGLLNIGIHYIGASCIGYIGGILNGYILSSKFVFKEKMNTKKSLKFLFIYATSLVINLVIVTLLIELVNVNKILAQLLATGFNIIYNYSLNSIWTFKRKNSN